MSEKNKERAFIRFNLIARSVPPPIASVTNGGVIVLVDAPWGATCGVGLMPGPSAPLHFRVGRNDLNRDYLADFRALGLLEVQPGKSLSSMFRMQCAS
jgi:hypothetical protein